MQLATADSDASRSRQVTSQDRKLEHGGDERVKVLEGVGRSDLPYLGRSRLILERGTPKE
jgi:hypothetical protein